MALLGAVGFGAAGAAKPSQRRRRVQRRTKERHHRTSSPSNGNTPSPQAFGFFPGSFIARTTVSKDVTVPAGVGAGAGFTVVCPKAAAGEIVVATGGGYFGSGLIVDENHPGKDDTSWFVHGQNTTNNALRFSAFVVCVRYQAPLGTE
jgi:hypothetical protein